MPAASLLMVLNFCMYAVLLGIGGWAMNEAIAHGFVIGIICSSVCLLLHFSLICVFVNFRVQDTRRGELCLCQIFANPATWLILQPDLDTAVGKYAENNEHREFYVETLCPTKEKTTTYHP